ncbi:MAG: tyrosine-type recombinase/integrase [Candidatus Margulisbacteria bacterium]|nr:tyrosine-type recombinase/integrase [Candidatus Margulisiibacteriota bacterium]
MKVFLSFCFDSNIDYTNITQEIITKFLNENTYASNTINNFIKAGRSFYGDFLGKETEWKKIKLLKAERKIPNYLSEKEIQQGIKYIKSYHSNIYSKAKIDAVINFMFYSAVRKGELLSLHRTDFNLEENYCKVSGQKSKRERYVYFPDEVKKYIDIYFQSEAEETNAFNISLMIINYLTTLMTKYINKKVTPHLIRHSGLRYMKLKGIAIDDIKEIAGHSDIKTTMIYTLNNEEDIRRAYKDKIK